MTEMPPGFLEYILENRIRLDTADEELKKTHPYVVEGVDLRENNIADISKWCRENIADHYWCMANRNDTFYFEFALDAVAFKLRWI